MTVRKAFFFFLFQFWNERKSLYCRWPFIYESQTVPPLSISRTVGSHQLREMRLAHKQNFLSVIVTNPQRNRNNVHSISPRERFLSGLLAKTMFFFFLFFFLLFNFVPNLNKCAQIPSVQKNKPKDLSFCWIWRPLVHITAILSCWKRKRTVIFLGNRNTQIHEKLFGAHQSRDFWRRRMYLLCRRRAKFFRSSFFFFWGGGGHFIY